MNMIKDGGCCYDNIKQQCTDLTEQATAGLFELSSQHQMLWRAMEDIRLENDYLWVATSRS